MCRVCGAASSIPIVFTLNCLLVHPAFLAACLLQLVSDISTRRSPWSICHWAKPMSGPFPVLNFLMTLQPMTCWSCLLWTIDSLSVSILHRLGFLTGFSLWSLFSMTSWRSHPFLFLCQKPPRWTSRIHDFLELLRSLCRHSLKPQTLHVQNLIFLSISPQTLPVPTALSLICLFLLIMLLRFKMTGSLPFLGLQIQSLAISYHVLFPWLLLYSASPKFPWPHLCLGLQCFIPRPLEEPDCPATSFFIQWCCQINSFKVQVCSCHFSALKCLITLYYQ